MAAELDTQWLVDLHEENATTLHRLVVLLGAEPQSDVIVRNALLSLGRRGRRLVDPAERLEYVEEMVVHQARIVRGTAPLRFPQVEDHRQKQILRAISRMPIRFAEPLVVSHYLQTFGPELAGILRMTVRSTNLRVEDGLELLRRAIGDPTPGSLPGVVESLSEEVAAALRSAARTVPAPETEPVARALDVITAGETPGMSPWVLVPLALALLITGAWLGGMSVPRESEQTAPTPSSLPSASAPVSVSLPAQLQAVPIYYVGVANGMLYRELRDVPASGDIVEAALSALLQLPPLDPDYASAWGPGQLLSAQLKDSLLTIDLTADAYEKLTPQTAARAANQMVYTASDLVGDPDLRVTFLIDGKRPQPGTLVIPEGGFARRGLLPMPALWLSRPKNGATVDAGLVTIDGTVKLGAPAPVVKVTNEAGREVVSASAQTSTSIDNQGWRSWSVLVSLASGQYQVTAETHLTDAIGGKHVFSETKTVTVR